MLKVKNKPVNLTDVYYGEMNKTTRRTFIKSGAILSSMAVVSPAVSNPTNPELASITETTLLVNQSPKLKGKFEKLEVGETLWVDGKLLIKLSENSFDQVYPAIARYA